MKLSNLREKLKKSRSLKVLLALYFFFFFCQPVLATDIVTSSSSSVSATVPNFSFASPALIAPENNSVLNYTQPTFSWWRPTPNPGNLSHYDLYIDNQFFANISNSLTSQDYYFYSATASANIFYVTLKTDLAQGYHNWSVTAWTDNDQSASTGDWTFYIDSQPPFISVTHIDSTTYTWNTDSPSSLPTGSNQYISVNTPNPLLKGDVEAFANFQVSLICPTAASGCTNQTWIGNFPSGHWENHFYNLATNTTYTVKLQAVDAAGNNTTFPDFYLTYGVMTTTPTASITNTPIPTKKPSLTPTTTPTPTISETVTPTPTASVSGTPTINLPSAITPPPGLLNIITPAPFIPSIPVPTPPPISAKTPTRGFQDLFTFFLIILVVIGLPLHMIMAVIGTQTPFSSIPQFLFVLAYPFFFHKKQQTVPFSFIRIFQEDKLDHPWQFILADINGYFNFKGDLPNRVLIEIHCLGRLWKNTLVKGPLLLASCLFPNRKTKLSRGEQFSFFIFDIRFIPLVLAILTSSIAIFIVPSLYLLIYLYLSLQFAYSEYLYPKKSQG